MTNLEQRALSAYFRSASNLDGAVIQPGAVEEVTNKGLRYIRLGNVNGVLAVYRVRTVNGDFVLKGLKRWPIELN